jgi:hypothetical protein
MTATGCAPGLGMGTSSGIIGGMIEKWPEVYPAADRPIEPINGESY